MCFAIRLIVGKVFLNIFKTSRFGLMIVASLTNFLIFQRFFSCKISVTVVFTRILKQSQLLLLALAKLTPFFRDSATLSSLMEVYKIMYIKNGNKLFKQIWIKTCLYTFK